MMIVRCLMFVAVLSVAPSVWGQLSENATTLTNSHIQFTGSSTGWHKMSRNGVTAIIVDNSAPGTPELTEHRAGYNGIAFLSHEQQPGNLFVPRYAGVNFEHIHDGTTAGLIEKFEPRKFPMELRIVDEFTVELYQPPTGNWQLESCGRYQMLPDGVIEYTFECIPRATDYTHNYIGLFWASYIDQPTDKAIQFQGYRTGQSASEAQWIRAVTPEHGINSTHAPAGMLQLPHVDADFPLKLINGQSKMIVAEPWYYGRNGELAFVQMFRQQDHVWLAQSPTGGGANNPAWDFQWFINNPQVNQSYGFVMRAAYVPFEEVGQIEQLTRPHRQALNP